ncbi:predicted protein, partial [Nematostella vectensis]
NILDSSRNFTKRPHIGGGEQSQKLGCYIRDKWLSYGFDKVEMPRYDVLLSLPSRDKPNAVKIIDNSTGEVLTDEPSENDPLVLPPFLAYSPPGDVMGELIYVNYGTVEDFKKFEDLKQSCKGKIAIMRYGRIFRGDKVKHAAECGAIGVILFSDPIDVAPEGMDKTFPKTWWLSGTGAQRGSILKNNYYGDPLTPLLPSTEGIYRNSRNDTNALPTIPAQPLPYNDALEFLKRMKGPEAPDSWQGGLQIKYKLGPGFTDPNTTTRLIVNNEFVTRPGYNVIGTITGQEEPDRIVLYGNHRDAWVFGGVDSSSGSAVMMELSRGLGYLLKNKKWRPRRTIMLCSWAVEEYGLIGSAEWVNENEKMLTDRAVAYINIDSGVAGNYSFNAAGNPLLQEMAFNETRLVRDYNTRSMSVYDKWSMSYPSDDHAIPAFKTLGSGSDYTTFVQSVGIPSLDMSYTFKDSRAWPYPVYHSVHDTFYLQKKFNDPYFKSHLTMAKISGKLLTAVADSPLLPFSTRSYKDSLAKGYRQLQKTFQDRLSAQNITLDYIGKEIENFADASDNFESAKATLDNTTDFMKLRLLNDQMAKLERAFIWPYGLPGRPDTRHVLYAPQRHNLYGSAVFPGIYDAMYDVRDDWMEVKNQISIVTQALRSAVQFIQPIQRQE